MTTAAYPARLDISARVPARPGELALIRTLARSYAADFGLSIEALDDVALAITEAAAFLVEHAGGTNLVIGLGRDDDFVSLSVIAQAARAIDPETWNASMACHVVRALASTSGLEQEESGSAIHMTISLG